MVCAANERKISERTTGGLDGLTSPSTGVHAGEIAVRYRPTQSEIM